MGSRCSMLPEVHSARLLGQRLQFGVLDVKVGVHVLDIFMFVQFVYQPQHLVGRLPGEFHLGLGIIESSATAGVMPALLRASTTR